MRRFLIHSFIFVLLSGLLAAQGQFQLPQIINGDGIQTTFLFFNNGDAPAMVFLNLTDDNGDALNINIPGLTALVPGSYSLSLNPGQSRFVISDGQGNPPQIGAGTVTSTGSLGVSAILSLFEGATEAGISTSERLSSFDIAVDLSGSFNTGLAVQNTSGSQTTLTMTLFDASGVQQGAPINLDLAGNGHFAAFVGGPDGLFQTSNGFRGKLRVAATNDVAALTLRQELTTFVLTTLPVVPSDSGQTEFNLPQAANGGGIKTTFVLFGLGQQANVQLSLTQDDGTALSVGLSDGQNGSQFDLDIPANGALFLETDGQGALPVVGAAQVTSNAPIGVSAIFTIQDGSGSILTETGVGDSPALAEFTFPLTNAGTFNTGLALFNPNQAAATVDLTYFDPSGVAQQTVSARIDPFQLNPLNHDAKFVSERDGSLTGLEGSVAVTSTQPISALTLRQNTSPLTLTTLPVAEGAADSGQQPPPGGTGLLLARRETVASLTQNTTQDVVLPNGFEITGTITPPGLGSFVLSVTARGEGSAFPGVTNVLTNQYRVVVPAGTFELAFCYSAVVAPGQAPVIQGAGVPAASAFLEHVENVTVNANTTRDVVLPNVALHNVSGTVAGLEQLPAGFLNPMGLGVIFTSTNSASTGIGLVDVQDGSYTALAADGDYTVSLFAGDFEETDAATILFGIGQVNVNGSDVNADLALPPLVELSGTVDSPLAGQLPDNTFVAAFDATGPGDLVSNCFPAFAISVAEADRSSGEYAAPLIANRPYRINAELPVTSIGTSEEGSLFIPQFLPPSQQFAVDTVRDFVFPNPPQQVTLSGRVSDGDGVGVSGASVDVFSQNLSATPNSFFVAGTTTNATGNYSLTVLSGLNYDVEASIAPPVPGMGFPVAEASVRMQAQVRQAVLKVQRQKVQSCSFSGR